MYYFINISLLHYFVNMNNHNGLYGYSHLTWATLPLYAEHTNKITIKLKNQNPTSENRAFKCMKQENIVI